MKGNLPRCFGFFQAVQFSILAHDIEVVLFQVEFSLIPDQPSFLQFVNQATFSVVPGFQSHLLEKSFGFLWHHSGLDHQFDVQMI